MRRIAAFGLCGLMLHVAGLRLNAQVILYPNDIEGTVQFTNANPVILDLLGPPGDLGITEGVIYADTLPPAPLFQTYGIFTTSAPSVSGTYQITVESGNPGIAYSIEAYVDVNTDDIYWFNAVNSTPLTTNGPPATVNLNEAATALNFEFVTDSGTPVPISGGTIQAYVPLGGLQAAAYSINPGSTNRYLFVRGGTNFYYISAQYQIGSNLYSDEVQYQLITNLNTTPDQVVSIPCIVLAATTGGQITGNVGLTGKFLETVADQPNSNSYPDLTLIEANNGPFGNVRYATITGSNYTIPSSGPYAITNLPPSDLATPPQGYSVHVEMAYDTNYQYAFLRTPGLGEGTNNPPVMIDSGDTVDLGDTFNINPGHVVGTVLLQGPAETGDTNSFFRSVYRSADEYLVSGGIPASVQLYGNYYSFVEILGQDLLAPGATLTAVNGECLPTLQGSFNSATSAFEGNYDATLGGLNSQPSIWKVSNLDVLFDSAVTTNENEYADQYVEVSDLRGIDSTVLAGQTNTNNIAYCFGEVDIRFRSSSGNFYAPLINSSTGSFTGTDFQGNPANYTVYIYDTYGTPAYASEATNTGFLRMVLPEGSYTLYPYVSAVNSSGNSTTTALSPVTLTIGCQQHILLDQCLQLNLDAPACVNTSPYDVTGTVASCTNVVSITYQLGDGPTNIVCTNCGVSPGFSFPLTFTPEDICSNQTLVVTATDASGEVSSVTSQLAYNVVPPDITCSSNIIIQTTNANPVPVSFDVSGFSYCGTPVTITCNPPSGSLFPPGTNTVTCNALDGCGNSSSCDFTVTVIDTQPILGITLDASCCAAVYWANTAGYILQQNPNLANGSNWVNNTSPVYTDSGTNYVFLCPLTNYMFFRLANP